MFHCWHEYQSLTVDVFSVVGAPWRCGVLTTSGGIAGIGLGHLLEEHDANRSHRIIFVKSAVFFFHKIDDFRW